MFETVGAVLEQLTGSFKRLDIDNIDRFNHRYATLFFIFASVLVLVRMHVGELINCWAPAEFADNWVEYANSLCWISNTYYVPPSKHDILSPENRTEISYYQWVPFVLLIQAFMCYLPCTLWGVFNKSLGTNIKGIITEITHIDMMLDDKTRSTRFQQIARHFHRLFKSSQVYDRSGACGRLKNDLANRHRGCGRLFGNYLITLYIILKLAHVGNVLLQIYMLQVILGTNYTFYGFQVLHQLATEGSFDSSRHFPTITLCDFEIRSIGRTIPYSVQCTLPVNIFNEKIFITVWFVLCLLLLINSLSLVYWLSVTFTTNRRRYLKKMLKVANKYDRERDQAKLAYLSNQYLRQDGVFILRLIGTRLGDLAAYELVEKLWMTTSGPFRDHSKPQEV